MLDLSELNLDLLEDEDKLVANDSKGEDENENSKEAGFLVSAGEDALDSVEGVSLDEVLKLASDSLSNSYFLSFRAVHK